MGETIVVGQKTNRLEALELVDQRIAAALAMLEAGMDPPELVLASDKAAELAEHQHQCAKAALQLTLARAELVRAKLLRVEPRAVLVERARQLHALMAQQLKAMTLETPRGVVVTMAAQRWTSAFNEAARLTNTLGGSLERLADLMKG